MYIPPAEDFIYDLISPFPVYKAARRENELKLVTSKMAWMKRRFRMKDRLEVKPGLGVVRIGESELSDHWHL